MDQTNFKHVCNVCSVCQQLTYPGESHFACEPEIKLGPIHQCIYCLCDERSGDHSECQDKIAQLRHELISFFTS